MDMRIEGAGGLFPAARLRTGDVLVMMGEGPLSELIAWASDGIHSHAAIVADDGDLIEAATAGVRRYPLHARLVDLANYRFIDALRFDRGGGQGLEPADATAVLAKAASLLGTPYPVDQLALLGVIMAVRGKWPVHPWGRLLARVALDHALPGNTGRMVCSEVVYRAYAECAATPAGRLAPMIVVGERGTAPFPDIDWKALFDEIWPLLQPEARTRLQPARLRLDALGSVEPGLLGEDPALFAPVSDEELEAARRLVLGQSGLPVARGQGAVLPMAGPDTVLPDPNPRLVSPQDLAASPSLVRLGRLMQRDTGQIRDPA